MNYKDEYSGKYSLNSLATVFYGKNLDTDTNTVYLTKTRINLAKVE